LTSPTGAVPLVIMRYNEPNALQIRVTLAEIDPLVWRRLVVPLSWHLGELHLAIQAAFNWWNSHLHEYRIGGLRYGDSEVGDEGGFPDSPRLFDETAVRLSDFGFETGVTFTYVYDFGDNWRHIVEIERPVALEATPRLASCVAGARARPPEDVGGVSGYENFLSIMADPTDQEYAEIRRWCGGHFDPEWFDLEMTDKDVKNALRANVRRRLHQPKPKRGPRLLP
jgi:hypothetical protein